LQESDPGFSEAQLSRARSGDAAAFAALVQAYQRLVYGIARRMLGDAALAEDVAQEVFVALHRSLKSLESLAHLIFWLRRASAHRAIDRLRARGQHWLPLSAAEHVVAPAAERDPLLELRLQQLLLLLSPAARAVLVLRYQQDLEPTEIARTLDMPLNTVKSHLKRSVATLRDWLLEPGAATVSREP